jgi:hypothetical protein
MKTYLKKWINPAHIVSVNLEETEFWLDLYLKTADGNEHQVNSFMVNRKGINLPNERDLAEKVFNDYKKMIENGTGITI